MKLKWSTIKQVLQIVATIITTVVLIFTAVKKLKPCGSNLSPFILFSIYSTFI